MLEQVRSSQWVVPSYCKTLVFEVSFAAVELNTSRVLDAFLFAHVLILDIKLCKGQQVCDWNEK